MTTPRITTIEQHHYTDTALEEALEAAEADEAAVRCPVCGSPLPAASRDRRVTHSGAVVCDRASCEERSESCEVD